MPDFLATAPKALAHVAHLVWCSKMKKCICIMPQDAGHVFCRCAITAPISLFYIFGGNINDSHCYYYYYYIAAGETKIKAIGTTDITITFAGEEFPFEFQVVERLSTNVLIGMNFILKYYRVPCANDQLFTLGNARIKVPMVVKGSCLGLAKFREQVTSEPHTQHLVGVRCPYINDQSVFLLEPLPNTEILGFHVPRTILSTKGLTYCLFWNSTDEPITLSAGSLIGQILPVGEILSIAQENNHLQIRRLVKHSLNKTCSEINIEGMQRIDSDMGNLNKMVKPFNLNMAIEIGIGIIINKN